jgi:hypothetical protein
VSFDITNPEGQALIGSPIGAAVAHMLTGHKAELGVKWVNKVTIFTKDTRPDDLIPKTIEMHMFFHIEDVSRTRFGLRQQQPNYALISPSLLACLQLTVSKKEETINKLRLSCNCAAHTHAIVILRTSNSCIYSY